jgi:hypothetical protein
MTTPGSYYSEAMTGANSGRPGETPSLEETSALWSQRASAASTTPRSVLQQYQIAPGNGRADRDEQRVLPGGQAVVSTTNGMSPETNEAQMPLKMAGDLPL